MFGAASAPNPFAAATTSNPFASASTPAFGAAPTPSFIGAQASTPAFGTPGASAPAFGTPGASAPAFGTTNPITGAAGTSIFGQGAVFGQPAPGGIFGQQQQQQQPQHAALITYSSKFEELHPDRQRELQEIQNQVSGYREECVKLENDPRLNDSAALKKSMEGETSSLTHNLQAMLSAVRADDAALADFREKVMLLLRATESAVRTYQRAKLWRDAPQMYRGQTMPAQVQELLSTPVVLPSPYLEQAVQGFQEVLQQYTRCIAELEQAMPRGGNSSASGSDGVDGGMSISQLPLVISQMHAFFVHVAAKMEALHGEVQRTKEAFLQQRRADGDLTDPFAESRRYQQLSATSSKLVVIPPATGTAGGQAGLAGAAATTPASLTSTAAGGVAAGGFGAGLFGTPGPTAPASPFVQAAGGSAFGAAFSGQAAPAPDFSKKPSSNARRRK